MVLGLRTKNRKGVSIQVNYLVHVIEVKPWPPTQSLRSVQSVLLQWENGDQSSMSPTSAVPSLSSGVGDGKIEFNESFRLPVTLCREASGKSKARNAFQKNCLEFYLNEPRKDKAVKGQLLGTAVINLADYGIIKETITVSAPVNCKRSFRNTVQPFLFIKIQPFDKDSSSSSPKGSLLKEASLDNDGSESISELMNEENDEEAEVTSFTDDDVSSHSSRTISSRNGENESESAKDGTGRGNGESDLPSGAALAKSEVNSVTEAFKHPKESLSPSSMDLSSDLGNPVNYHASLSKFPDRSLVSIQKKSVTHCVQSSSSSLRYQDANEESGGSTRSFEPELMAREVYEKVADGSVKIRENAQPSVGDKIIDSLVVKVASSDTYIQVGMNSDLASFVDSQANGKDDEKSRRQSENGQEEATTINDLHVGPVEEKEENKQQKNGQEEQILEEKKQFSENKLVTKFSQDATRKQVKLRSDTLSFSRRALGVQGSIITSDNLKHVKSNQLPFDSAKSNRLFGHSQFMEKAKEIDIMEDADNNATTGSKETRNGFSDSKIELDSRIEMLEEELREAAALEVGLYSVVAEHGSSTNKVHSPARRLSRFYFHACKARSQAKRASAARAVVSGLVLVSKACGNDVPRLTFWLSNSIVLRAIVIQAAREVSLSAGPCLKSNGDGEGLDERSASKWDESSLNEEDKNGLIESFNDWKDPQTFITALEKIEAWIFSRILESVWWQTLTPYMQSTAAKTSDRSMGSSSRKMYGRRYALGDQEQGNFSIDLWKKAFKDACERLCPIRAGGHECGCLPVLARLVMEQLVGRLDVAMFNAILRESAEEMPTDPVSDPISDSKVLPIPAGKSSFGAGAQLKNAIGSWSRWLTDLFGIDDNDAPQDKDEVDDDKRLECETSFKAFHLLNALSDLMMVPNEMLADRSIRKEVCPTFGALLIKRILNNFVPDEFCPDPVPNSILESLDSENSLEDEEETVTSFPCIATPAVYSPPSATSLTGIVGEVGSQTLLRRRSSVLRKSYTSDDELDELDSPINSVSIDNIKVSPTSTRLNCTPKGKGVRNVVRYQLLREVWRDGE